MGLQEWNCKNGTAPPHAHAQGFYTHATGRVFNTPPGRTDELQ